jgi:hypothetical protein
MVTRTFNKVIWEAKSPSHYILTGFPIEAKFMGDSWYITTGTKDNKTYKFRSMIEISELISDTVDWMGEQKLLDNK